MHTRGRVVAVTVRVTTLKGPDAGAYYVEALADYYLEAGEPAGVWRGDGAEYLGLVGEVDDDAFLDVMAGLRPNTQRPLGRRYGQDSVRGFDVTASAPKSVSVLFALGDEVTRRAVVEAHEAAVGAMVDWIQEHAHTRYRIDGQVATVDAEGIVAACFRQHTSRALDPQLHTHVVIANRVAADDGRWLALDARTLKLDQRSLSALYHASLRAELTRSLGVAWEEPVHGIAEMADLPEELRAEFSSRTRAVQDRTQEKLERFVSDLGRDPTPRERWRLEREAVTDSRPSKSHNRDAASLRAEWAERASAMGWEPHRLTAQVVPAQPACRAIDDVAVDEMVTQALEALAEHQSTWRPAELVRQLAAAVPTQVTTPADDLVPWLDRLADQVMAQRLVELSPSVPGGVRRRRDGRPVTESVADRALTTPEILAQEERLLAWAERRLETGGGDATLHGAGQLEHLSGPQAEMARALAGTRDLVLVVGPAGAGKTAAVGPAVDQLRSQGRAVFGVAPSAAAAEVLGTDAGLAADTVDKLLVEHRLARPPDHRYDLPRGATVVIDEAAMVSTPQLAELADLADARGWRLALMGDPLQFSAVGRSGMFAHLVDTHGAIELDRVHRFAQSWERVASLRLRRGDPDVLERYAEHGRIHGGSRGQMETAVIDAWWRTRAEGQTAAMMAPTNDTVVRLNLGAQRRRAGAGQVDLAAPSVSAGPYRVVAGDLVATRHNDRRLRTDRNLMVKNRDQWEVLGVHRGGALSVRGGTGAVVLPAHYVAEHVELAYAQTSHTNQGRTVDRSFLLVDGPVDTRGVYVPMTRGRHDNQAFVVTHGEQSALDVMAQALARDWIDQPAVARRAELAERADHVQKPVANRQPRDTKLQPRTTNGQPTTNRRPRVTNRQEHETTAPLAAFALRTLLERDHAISRSLSTAELQARVCSQQLPGAVERRAALVTKLAAARERQRAAQRVIDDYDHPVRRQLHRSQLGDAHATLSRTRNAVDGHQRELAETDERISTLQSSLAEARAVLGHRPALERERQQIHHRLGNDLLARKVALETDPPGTVVEFLGPRPLGGAAQVWDNAAARIDQHRTAFAIPDHDHLLGFLSGPWEDGAYATSRGQAASAADRLDRALGRSATIEPPERGLSIEL